MKDLKTCCSLLVLLLLCIASDGQTHVPAGTLLSVMLSSSIDSHKSKAGDQIKARLMQDVELGAGDKLHAGTTVVGEIANVTPSTVSFRFDRLVVHKKTVAIRSNLRAIASMMEIEDAQLPTNTAGGDRGSAEADWNTIQVGGEAVYGRRGGPVMKGNTVVGHSLFGGGVAAVPIAAPGTMCRGSIHEETPQAFWVFSASACGSYGFPDLSITHAGRTTPVGTIVLTSRGRVKVGAGSGMLLRVTSD